MTVRSQIRRMLMRNFRITILPMFINSETALSHRGADIVGRAEPARRLSLSLSLSLSFSLSL